MTTRINNIIVKFFRSCSLASPGLLRIRKLIQEASGAHVNWLVTDRFRSIFGKRVWRIFFVEGASSTTEVSAVAISDIVNRSFSTQEIETCSCKSHSGIDENKQRIVTCRFRLCRLKDFVHKKKRQEVRKNQKLN